jgi:hypothetical protein
MGYYPDPGKLNAIPMTEVITDANQPSENAEVILTKEQVIADVTARYKDLEPEKLLEKVAEDLAKKEEIIGFKNRALQAEKLKNKPADVVTPPEAPKTALTEDEILAKALKIFTDASSSKEVESTIKSLSADAEEETAIRNAYQNDIVKTGDVASDLKKATAIARANYIESVRSTKTQAEIDELIMTKFSGGAPGGRNSESTPTLSLKQKNAAETLRSQGIPEDRILKVIAGIK